MWILEGKEITEIPSGNIKPEGFVYKITNLISGKMYIGKKSFGSSKTITVKDKKGNSKKKKTIVESNWKEYFGSNESLKEDVKSLGEENFKREILKICISKSEVSYWEAKYQFLEDVLYKPDQYYNSWIMVRCRTSHLMSTEKKRISAVNKSQ